MSTNARTSAGTSAGEVMASIDESTTSDRLVIADITRDDAFLSVHLEDALTTREWR